MNTRILDIIRNPENIKIEDLKLLETEIEKLPYMQSLRAIYLLGIHKYQQDEFQQELTKTAAYTTDKKILYNFINQIKTENNSISEKIIEKPITEEKNITTEENLSFSSKENEKTPTGIDYYTKNIPQQKEKDLHFTQNKNETEKPKYEPKTHIMDFYASAKKEEKKEIHSPINFYEKPISSLHTEENSVPIEQKEETKDIITENEEYQWKPMQLENISPISTKTFDENKKTSIEPSDEIIENESSLIEEDNISNKQQAKQDTSNSNVSAFINTWQSWLKIDRTPQLSEQEKKAAIIDRFIENNPKISPIKEDGDYVVKEKSDDISHLMTETLAQLYLEQKLYTKAINAYKILQEKHPERFEDFEEKIEEIKKSRNMK